MLAADGLRRPAVSPTTAPAGPTATPTTTHVTAAAAVERETSGVDVVVDLLTREVRQSRAHLRAAEQRLARVEEENRALRQQRFPLPVASEGGPEDAWAQRRRILSVLPFLSDYPELASPSVPFVVTDIDTKPVVVVKVTLRQPTPMVCVFANSPFCSLVNCSMAELIGERALTTLLFDYRNKIKLLSFSITTRSDRISEPTSVSTLLLHKDGSIIRVPTTIQLFRLTDGQLGWMVATYDDTSFQVESMSALEKSSPRLYARLLSFSQDSGVVGSLAEVVERRKDAIRECERGEWRDLLLPMCNTGPRILAALTQDSSTESASLPPLLPSQHQYSEAAALAPLHTSSPFSSSPSASPSSTSSSPPTVMLTTPSPWDAMAQPAWWNAALSGGDAPNPPPPPPPSSSLSSSSSLSYGFMAAANVGVADESSPAAGGPTPVPASPFQAMSALFDQAFPSSPSMWLG